MKCGYCHKEISARDQKHAVMTYENGKLVAAYHKAHARTARGQAREGGPMPGRTYNEWSPGAYDVDRVTKEDVEEQEALERHRAVLEESRREEEVPKDWADQRDPETATLDELVGGDADDAVSKP